MLSFLEARQSREGAVINRRRANAQQARREGQSSVGELQGGEGWIVAERSHGEECKSWGIERVCGKREGRPRQWGRRGRVVMASKRSVERVRREMTRQIKQ